MTLADVDQKFFMPSLTWVRTENASKRAVFLPQRGGSTGDNVFPSFGIKAVYRCMGNNMGRMHEHMIVTLWKFQHFVLTRSTSIGATGAAWKSSPSCWACVRLVLGFVSFFLYHSGDASLLACYACGRLRSWMVLDWGCLNEWFRVDA